MFKASALTVITVLALAPNLVAQTQARPQRRGIEISTGAMLGYSNGVGIQAHATASDFAESFPVRARLWVGYSMVQPGNAHEARRIFINNATNGSPEKSGSTWDFALDLLFSTRFLSLENAYWVAGVRRCHFMGNFRYIGGNEDFDVISDHWGLGGGLEAHFRMSRTVDLVLNGGLDYFFASTLSGHDTAYSPDGDDVNPREDYTYGDADDAIRQPKYRPRLMLGFNYHF
jgi:hypothetical protein